MFSKVLNACATWVKDEIRIPPASERCERARYLWWTFNNGYKARIPVTWLIDGWHQYIYEPKNSLIKYGTYSAKVNHNSVKKLLITDSMGILFLYLILLADVLMI